jgi:N-acetylneuraminic acid mutarotase
MEALLSSTGSADGGSVWTRLAAIPGPEWPTIETVLGHVLAIGGRDADRKTIPGAIYWYDVTTNSWSVIGEMPTPRYHVLTAVLPSNELVMVGGRISKKFCYITEICSSHTSP